MFEYFGNYFPVKLIKTAELPTGTNYLMVMYPHGILPMGVLPNFGSSANKIETEVFPGIDVRFITLDINFYCPVTREYFLSLGKFHRRCQQNLFIYLWKYFSFRCLGLLANPIRDRGADKSMPYQKQKTYKIVNFSQMCKKSIPNVKFFGFSATMFFNKCWT